MGSQWGGGGGGGRRERQNLNRVGLAPLRSKAASAKLYSLNNARAYKGYQQVNNSKPNSQ